MTDVDELSRSPIAKRADLLFIVGSVVLMLDAIGEDEITISLDAAGLPGAVATVTPLDETERATWSDTIPDMVATFYVAGRCRVRKQLISIDGVVVKGNAGDVAPFDPKNPQHMAALPIEAVARIYARLLESTPLMVDAVNEEPN